ncbi:protein belonging to Uncharacterized protein family UPF0251 [Candidatus Magnetomorum sp. HK-1]|nr:protein belonging to Uncharacterized protein family UPF0251 [Candidatus Magnetomorum sp. HK-1]
MPRPIKKRIVLQQPNVFVYIPSESIPSELERMNLPVECMEAIRLIDVEGMNQSKAASIMNVSRQTFGRILSNGRSIVANALTYGKAIQIDGGTYQIFEKGRQGRYRKRCLQHKHEEVNTMPNKDGSGPAGQGRGTGQGKGMCNNPGGQGGKSGGGCRGGGGGRGGGKGQGGGGGRGGGQGQGKGFGR